MSKPFSLCRLARKKYLALRQLSLERAEGLAQFWLAVGLIAASIWLYPGAGLAGTSFLAQCRTCWQNLELV